jgi:hypothetical protein
MPSGFGSPVLKAEITAPFTCNVALARGCQRLLELQRRLLPAKQGKLKLRRFGHNHRFPVKNGFKLCGFRFSSLKFK